MSPRTALTGLLALFLCACGTREWSAADLRAWYADSCAEDETIKRPRKPLFYRGSDTTHHYFMCRPIDSWVFMKVPRGQISIPLEKPHIQNASADPFPGYYAVDPLKGFQRLKLSD